MDQPTIRVLAHLLDFRGTFETGRVKGHIPPDAPGAEPEDARLVRNRSWSSFEKILEHQPLTREERETAQETFEWYRELPEASQLPLDEAEQMFDVWQIPLDSPDLIGLFEVERQIIERWLDEDDIEDASDRGRPAHRSNGDKLRPRSIPGEDVSFEAEEAYEQARAGFSELARLVGGGETKRAVEVVDEIESHLETVREAMVARSG